MLLRARAAVRMETGTPVYCSRLFFSAFAPISGLALTVLVASGLIPQSRARASPPEQFTCSKSAWLTRHSPTDDVVARTLAEQKGPTGKTTPGSTKISGGSSGFVSFFFHPLGQGTPAGANVLLLAATAYPTFKASTIFEKALGNSGAKFLWRAKN